jgi:rhodanese-related sulfurtransferase
MCYFFFASLFFTFRFMKVSSFLLVFIIGGVAGLAGAYGMIHYSVPSQAELIDAFYQTETAVHVSPHHIRKDIAKGKHGFILVDLRSQEEYEREHVVGAINIPAYKDPETSAYEDVERIVGGFRALDSSKDIIVYCYSIPCMTGRKIGKLLADNGVYVKHLGVGWNEWRYFWTQWNHEHEWDEAKVEDYIKSGPEPGVYTGEVDLNSPCSLSDELGC